MPLDVAIVCSSEILATALYRSWPVDQNVSRAHLGTPADLAGGGDGPRPDILLLFPQTWLELKRLLDDSAHARSSIPWLVLADLRVAGMFVSALDLHPCTVGGLGAPRADFYAALPELSQGTAPPPSAVLLEYLVRAAPVLAKLPARARPTEKEIECACALALGLTNKEIAAIFGVEHGTVKCHVHNLYEKTGLKTHQALAAALLRALAPPHEALPGPVSEPHAPSKPRPKKYSARRTLFSRLPRHNP